jgi:mRNA interferase MazF
MPCSRHDIVLLPIPFTDLRSTKVRPAIVVGHGAWPGDLFVVPISSQIVGADLTLLDWQAAGLNVASGIKSQICTVEDRLVRKVVGRLSSRDSDALDNRLRVWLKL